MMKNILLFFLTVTSKSLFSAAAAVPIQVEPKSETSHKEKRKVYIQPIKAQKEKMKREQMLKTLGVPCWQDLLEAHTTPATVTNEKPVVQDSHKEYAFILASSLTTKNILHEEIYNTVLDAFCSADYTTAYQFSRADDFLKKTAKIALDKKVFNLQAESLLRFQQTPSACNK